MSERYTDQEKINLIMEANGSDIGRALRETMEDLNLNKLELSKVGIRVSTGGRVDRMRGMTADRPIKKIKRFSPFNFCTYCGEKLTSDAQRYRMPPMCSICVKGEEILENTRRLKEELDA